jgi:hypothetical protein
MIVIDAENRIVLSGGNATGLGKTGATIQTRRQRSALPLSKGPHHAAF